MNSVVLVTVDCLRPDHVHSYGYERPTTPNIDELVGEGVAYQNAYTNGPGTRWAFRSINMGVYPLQVEGAGLPSDEGVTLAEALSAKGYRTAAFVDNAFLTPHFNHDRGFDRFFGTKHYRANSFSDKKEMLHKVNDLASNVSERLSDGTVYRQIKRVYDRFIRTVEAQTDQSLSSDSEVVDDAISWIDDTAQNSDPYFAWIHLMDAHHPHQYHPEHRDVLDISKDSEHIRVPSKIVEPGEEPRQSVIDT